MCRLLINILDNRETGAEPVPSALIMKVLGAAYAPRAETDGAVNIMILNDARIAEMNQTYLSHEGATDVLAFYDGDFEDGVQLLGDIAVSADTARKIAVEKGMSFAEELTLYALHGLLHLLGMDDKTNELREEMLQAQEDEFARHGLKFIR